VAAPPARLLMDGDEPAGGRWNFDDQNREPPPRPGTGPAWPEPLRTPSTTSTGPPSSPTSRPPAWGADPDGTGPPAGPTPLAASPRRRRGPPAVRPPRGRHAHHQLAPGPHPAQPLPQPRAAPPGEVVQAAEDAYRSGAVPIASAEGFVRQVIGWREYVWGVYWLRRPEYRVANHLDADRPLPPAFTGEGGTRCAASSTCWRAARPRLEPPHPAADGARQPGAAAGVEPSAVTDWMWERYVDGAEWVMLPNVVGMALHADGGRWPPSRTPPVAPTSTG
jgi:deoxyribodipyrimidine photolyase-related protein